MRLRSNQPARVVGIDDRRLRVQIRPEDLGVVDLGDERGHLRLVFQVDDEVVVPVPRERPLVPRQAADRARRGVEQFDVLTGGDPGIVTGASATGPSFARRLRSR